MNTSFVFVFRRRLQDISRHSHTSQSYISHTSSEDVLKTSWSRPIYSSWPYVLKRPQHVFKTSSRRFQEVFKISSRRLAKTSSRPKGLKVCNPITNRFQRSCFPLKFAKFLRTPFFTEQLQWLLLRSRIKTNANFSNTYQIQLKKVLAAAKIQKKPPQVFCKRKPANLLIERGSSIANVLRTLILKNICERLLLKISISVTNSEAFVQRCCVKKVFLEILQNSQ